MTVHLEHSELRRAVALAQERNDRSRQHGRRPNHGGPAQGTDDALLKNVIGAYGEFAAAKYLGLPEPTSVDTFHLPDLGADIQVRARNTTNTRAKGDHMIVRHGDSDSDRYVLAIVLTPFVDLIGWLPGVECKREEWLFGYGPRPKSFFVPPAALRPIQNMKTERTPYRD